MEDLQWAVGYGEKDPISNSLKKNKEYSYSSSSSISSPSEQRLARSPKAIPRGKSLADHGNPYSSMPVDIPNWQKVYGKKGAKIDYDTESSQNDDVDADEDGEMIPPHEYIAKRFARAKISSFSMCEGNGRTLKGRDLRRVRNDILTKTGFLE